MFGPYIVRYFSMQAGRSQSTESISQNSPVTGSHTFFWHYYFLRGNVRRKCNSKNHNYLLFPLKYRNVRRKYSSKKSRLCFNSSPIVVLYGVLSSLFSLLSVFSCLLAQSITCDCQKIHVHYGWISYVIHLAGIVCAKLEINLYWHVEYL